jgi:hypothetical protein
MCVLWQALLCSAIFASVAPKDKAVLSLELFLKEVKDNNGAYKSHEEKMLATEDREAEKNLINSAKFILESNLFEDYRSSSALSVNYDHFYRRYFKTGFKKTFDSGLQTGISYDFSKFNFVKTEPFGEKDRMFGALWLTLSKDFLNDSSGEVIKAKKKRIDDERSVNYYEERHNLKRLLKEAETVYWHMVIAKEKKTLIRNNIKGLQKILDDAENDADNPEKIIQTKIALQNEKLNLLNIIAEEEELAWDFNNKRAVHSGIVKESLQNMPWSMLENYRVSEGDYKPTSKLRFLEKKKNVVEDDKIIEKNKYKSTLKIKIDYCLNGEEHSSQKAISNSLGNKIPYGFVGLKFATPVDRLSFEKFNKGLMEEENAAKLLYRQQYLAERMEWSKLIRKLEETQKKLKLSKSIEKLQRDRLNVERQKADVDNKIIVLQLQSELNRSKLNSLAIADEILEILTTLKLYD